MQCLVIILQEPNVEMAFKDAIQRYKERCLNTDGYVPKHTMKLAEMTYVDSNQTQFVYKFEIHVYDL